MNSITELINRDFEGNYKKFAYALNISSVTVYRLLTERSNAGEKFIAHFMNYCIKKGEKIENYFFCE